MRELNLKSKIVLFDSIRELTADRYNEYEKYALEMSGVGSDMKSIGQHFSMLRGYIGEQKTGEALQELNNLQLNAFYQINKLQFPHFIFSLFTYSIGNKPCENYSFEGLKATQEKLHKTGLTQKHVEEITDDIKKNLQQSLGFLSTSDTETTEHLISSQNLIDELS